MDEQNNQTQANPGPARGRGTPTILRKQMDDSKTHQAFFDQCEQRASDIRCDITRLGDACGLTPLRIFGTSKSNIRTSPVSYKCQRSVLSPIQRVRDAFGSDAPAELETICANWLALCKEYNAYLQAHHRKPATGRGG